MANTSTIEIVKDFVSLFFPNYCFGCEQALIKGEELICTACLLEMPRTNWHLDTENPLFNKFSGRIAASTTVAFLKFVKGSKVQKLLHALKYKNQPAIGRALGRAYGYDLAKSGFSEKFDLIVPVPLHKAKLRRRGYNQSEEFGLGLSETLNIPCDGKALQRVLMTDSQTRKSRLNRWRNVSNVFIVPSLDKVKGQRILLVDDVLTTGATLEAAGQALHEANCKGLGIVCIAATQ